MLITCLGKFYDPEDGGSQFFKDVNQFLLAVNAENLKSERLVNFKLERFQLSLAYVKTTRGRAEIGHT
jgi:hypothetical protein